MEVHARPGEGWEVTDDEGVLGHAWVWTRPDGRRFLHVGRDVPHRARLALVQAVPPAVDGELHVWVPSSAERLRTALAEQGFAPLRHEDHLELAPTRAASWLADSPGADVRLVGLDDVAVDDLRDLDERLRGDVPGCDGWRWDPVEFATLMHSESHDDALSRVALLDAEPVGLVRVWNDRDAPRLGIVGVLPRQRGRGVARRLLAAVVDELADRGEPRLVTEADPDNTPIRRLLDAMGATVTDSYVDMVRS